MSFHALGLRAELLSAIEKEGYRTPTPIQQKAIPAVLRGKDVLAGAQTGTGKTAAFALPILQNIAARRSTEKRPRVLILTPTRELANQIHDNILSFGRGLRVRSAVIFGGVGFTPQVERLSAGVDILTACPGRLLDHAGQKTVDLSGIEILVLDEADRMLDMGFIHDIKRVLALLPKKRQNLLFSATYSPEIEKLARSFLYEPELVEVSKRNTATPLVSHAVHPVPQRSKGALLAHLIQKEKWRQVLVFTRTKHGANRLAQHLCQGGIFAAAIHGNKSQSARTAALRDFKDGRISVLVATDIASRGLDIDQLPVVVNFELPNVPEDYIHRIGRTGRAGASGLALSLVDVEERKLLIGIERLLRKKIPETTVEGFDVTPMNTPAAGESGHTNRTGTAPKASVAAESSPPKRTRRRRRWGAASRDTKMPRA